MAIPQPFIQDLLARVDLVELIGRYVPLKRGGANYLGRCPFHEEKSPSFTVSPTKQFYHCFGCGQHGNAIGFLMEHQGLHYVEAIKELAQQMGMQVPDDGTSAQDRQRLAQQRDLQKSLIELLEKAATAYQANLKKSPRASDYLKGRGLSGQIAKHYGLGYAPPGYHHLSTVFAEYADPMLVESGMVIHNTEESHGQDERHDRFRDRVMFPIRNVKGECIGFGGRVLGDDKPKYLNSPETPVFSKGRELYGLFEARQTIRQMGNVLVTEGYMDVVALAQLGFGNAVATLGTACTPDHVHKLFQFSDNVVFSFDGDAAGRRAARKALDAALPYATDLRSVKFLFLPPEHDPDSFIRAQGSEAFAQQVAQAVPLSRFLLDAAAEGCDLDTLEGRSRLASQAKPLWLPLPDGALKRQLLAEISDSVQLAARELMDLWRDPATPPRGAKAFSSGVGGRTPSSPRGYPDAQRGGAPSSYRQGDAHSRGRFDNRKPPVGEGGTRDGWSKDYNFDSNLSNTDGGRDAFSSNAFPRPLRSRMLPAAPSDRRSRQQVTSREDHAARLLLSHASAWELLSGDEHALLCGLPAPHGALFTWLDHQHHEHGPQTWATLAEALQGLPFATLAHRLMGLPGDKSNWDEARQELADVMRRLMLDHLAAEKARLLQALALRPDDAATQARFAQISHRWAALKAPPAPKDA